MFLQLPKKKLLEVLKNLAHVYSSAWFKSEKIVIEKYGLDATLGGEFLQLFRDFGFREAKKMVDLNIIKSSDADSIIKGLSLSHWALFENIELEKISNKSVRMRTLDCSRQRYAKNQWGSEYPCKNMDFSIESRIGFVKAINSRAEVNCVFCPPDPKPKDVNKKTSCEWLITTPN
ncbi:MAG: DUF6125 family protein [Candidatus Bathyarchaeota archaeon]|jgi:hypothetical protein